MSIGGAECVVCGWPAVWRRSPSRINLQDIEADYRFRYFVAGAVFVAAMLNFYAPVYISQIGPPRGLAQSVQICAAAFLCGTIAAQLGMLAVWAALGLQEFGRRLLQSNLIFAGLFGALLAGAATVAPSRELPRLGTFFLAAPLVLLAAQAPLWLVRALPQRWGVSPADRSAGADPVGHQFRLRDLFIATASVAIALTIAKIGIALESPAAVAVSRSTAWINVMLVGLLSAAICTVSTLPCVRAACWARNTISSCLTVVLSAVAITIVVGAVLGALLGGPAMVAIFVPVSFVNGLFTIQLALLLAARALGCRLAGSRSTAPETLS